jgi:hypothetical protein
MRPAYSNRKTVYSLCILTLLGMSIVYGSTFAVDAYLQDRLISQQTLITTEQSSIDKLWWDATFAKYAFAKKFTEQNKKKRSKHIESLFAVLQAIQDNSYIWANAITLTDFSITPTSISLKWNVTNLILIYYSSEKYKYTSLIDRFTGLSFVKNVRIQQYTKDDTWYSFTLDADIITDDTSN